MENGKVKKKGNGNNAPIIRTAAPLTLPPTAISINDSKDVAIKVPVSIFCAILSIVHHHFNHNHFPFLASGIIVVCFPTGFLNPS